MRKSIVIALLIAVGLAYLSSYIPSEAPKRPLTPEELARKTKEDADWVREVLSVRQLRGAMKNPDSFNLEQALKMDNGTLCLQYRATNSFNAIVPGRAVITTAGNIYTSDSSGFATRWNANCGGKSGSDITYIRLAL